MKFRLPATATAAINNEALAASTATDIPSALSHSTDHEKGIAANAEQFSDSDSGFEEKIDPAAQRGTQEAQAVNTLWSRNELILAFICIWLIEFILAFGNGVIGTLTPYVTSEYSLHSLLALTGVIANIVSGLIKLPYAKLMDIWGRPQSLALGVGLITFGCVLMAALNSVEMYCAAQVFYWTGYLMIDFSITVFIADNTKLLNRGIFIAIASSPFLITTWVYGFAADDIIYGSTGIPWGFGIFAIFYPITCAPFLALLFMKQRKAQKAGLIPARQSTGNFLQSTWYYIREFDVIGLLILATGVSLFLLAFNIYSYQTDEWRSPLIICFLIFGALLIIAFGLYEKYVAPVSFVPWHLLKNRTVVGTYIMAAALYTSFYIWDSYFYSLLIVLFNQSVVDATYILNIYTIGSCFISLVYGLTLRYYGKLKIYSLFWGVPLTILGVGLMIAFRQPDVNIGYIVMCQIFVAFGGGVLVVSEQTTLMAVSKKRDFPALLAIESTVVYIAAAIGQTIAGAIWTGVFPVKLAENLPADAQADLATIYGSILEQTAYPVGSATRDAIDLSYGETQRYMLIASVCIIAIAFPAVAMWQNVDVRKDKKSVQEATTIGTQV